MDLVAAEKSKVKGAIRTDFILSAEIIVITLGTVATSDFATQLGVLAAITGGVGLLAGDFWLPLLPVLCALTQFVIRREENLLANASGKSYLAHKTRVRRWL